MPSWVWIIIAVTVIGEVAAVWVLLTRARVGGVLPGMDLGAIRELSHSIDQRVAEHLRANWDGRAETLSEALRGLLPEIRQTAQASGLPLDERALRLCVTNVVTGHGLARRDVVLKAFDRVEPPAQVA